MATKFYLRSATAIGVVPNAKQSSDTILDDFATSYAQYATPSKMLTTAGTGTIANYIAPLVKRVTGIESVEAAVRDATVNSKINGLTNTQFIAGEAEKVFTADYVGSHGKPDIIITDPPRNGMHENVVNTILELSPARVVYVSCNPATQARDLALMSGRYNLVKCQPVDMFPHTHHVENVALLEKQ